VTWNDGLADGFRFSFATNAERRIWHSIKPRRSNPVAAFLTATVRASVNSSYRVEDLPPDVFLFLFQKKLSIETFADQVIMLACGPDVGANSLAHSRNGLGDPFAECKE
jgi:hypothetical protein